jgi:hypothetical protein
MIELMNQLYFPAELLTSIKKNYRVSIFSLKENGLDLHDRMLLAAPLVVS